MVTTNLILSLIISMLVLVLCMPLSKLYTSSSELIVELVIDVNLYALFQTPRGHMLLTQENEDTMVHDGNGGSKVGDEDIEIVTSLDVAFDEENNWDWIRQQPTQVIFDNDSEREPTSVVFMPENSSEASPIAAEILPTATEATDTTAQSLQVVQLANGIFISQKKYVREILYRFQMKDCNPISTPTEFGLKLNTDHDGKKIYGKSNRNTFVSHQEILRYLQGTKDFGIFYKKGEKLELFKFTDSDYAGDQDDGRSTSGYVFMLGTGVVSWSFKKEPIVSLLTTEAEFIATTACACQAIWFRRILEELQFKQVEATIVFCVTT
ncbi:hypothetical protein ZIOFF_052028 [Zingiber officinale]|uniref:Uncharacterized protein n=1 Tax=Zingiber officinale TaxID=94328 RepID=A0A8J5FNL0_ZINOF|nr:hypothetical protein ZIOFF_052028 [Zingiber officinale]